MQAYAVQHRRPGAGEGIYVVDDNLWFVFQPLQLLAGNIEPVGGFAGTADRPQTNAAVPECHVYERLICHSVGFSFLGITSFYGRESPLK